jgi:hypothetical protein
MTATLDDVAMKKPTKLSAEQQAAAELVRQPKERGLSLTGSDGLLKQLTKSVIEAALSLAKWSRPSSRGEKSRTLAWPKTNMGTTLQIAL